MTAQRIETFRGRQLRRELLRLREAAGKSTEDVASELYWSKGKVSRIETGRSRVNPSDVRLLCDVYGVGDPERTVLIQLAREARNKGWWDEFAEVGADSYIALESQAATLRTYASHYIPDLLRTEAYVREVMRAERPEMSADEADRRVAASVIRRQRFLRDHGPRLWAIIDEAALRRLVGGTDVMREQLDRIVEAGGFPQVTIQVLPFSAGAHAARGISFTVLDSTGPPDLTVVHLAHLSGALYIDDEEGVPAYTDAFDQLKATAAGPGESGRVIARAAAEL